MVRVFKATADGQTMKVSDTNYFTTNERMGTAENTQGVTTQKSLHGIKLSVDQSGTITDGPDIMIGKSLSDVQMLTYSDVYQLMRTEAQIKSILNKSLLLGVDQISSLNSTDRVAIDKMQKEAEALIAGKIVEYKSQVENRKDPILR